MSADNNKVRKNYQACRINVLKFPTITCLAKLYLGNNCILNFHLGRYIVGYTVSFTATSELSRKTWFPNISRRYTSPNQNFEYRYPYSMHFCSFVSNFKLHSAAGHPTKCDIINDVKLFPNSISQDSQQYIAGYTITNFLCYPIRCRVTKASELE